MSKHTRKVHRGPRLPTPTPLAKLTKAERMLLYHWLDVAEALVWASPLADEHAGMIAALLCIAEALSVRSE